MEHNIGVVFNYCTNDHRFICYAIDAVKPFAKQIIVSTSDRFFDGSPENIKLLAKTKKENPEAVFVQFHFDTSKKVQPYLLWRLRRILKLPLQSGSQYWICYQRAFGYRRVNKSIDYVLFLDADEIIDTKRFIKWLNTEKYKKYKAMKFANYWYFRKTIYQATVWEDTPLMVKNRSVKNAWFFDYSEREGIYKMVKKRKKRMIVGADNKPMVHHYAWVRTKKQMLKKVSTWGHNRDADWPKLIRREFSRKFNGTDFVQKYTYKRVRPFIVF